MTRLSELGEFGLIHKITRSLKRSGGVVEGVGDDCAVLRMGGSLMLATCDASVEEVHFRRSWGRPREVGWKIAASAISDIAAMGGAARYVLAALASPVAHDTEYIEALAAGMIEAIEAAEAVLVGGDMTASGDRLAVDVTVLGEVTQGRYLSRSCACPGDLIAVTGYPGQSAAGLMALERHIDAPLLIESHLHPIPRLREGQWLARQDAVHAMIDLSDGLLQDTGHLADCSRVGINIDSDLVPLSPALNGFDSTLCEPLECLALSGGEDYELIIALDAGHAPGLCHAFEERFALPLTIVGRVETGYTGIRLDREIPGRRGFDHFGAG